MLGNALESQCELRDHAERPFRPDQQAGQVVARRGLRCAAAGTYEAPSGERRFEREDVVAHLPVPDGGRPGCVGRRHAAQGRVRAGVDGKEQAVLPGGAVQRVAGHAALHGGAQVARLDRDDPVHAAGVEADAAGHRDHVALEARPGAERGHRHRVTVGHVEDGRDLCAGARVHDGVGQRRPVERHVLRVQRTIRVPRGDAAVVTVERGDELGDDVGCDRGRHPGHTLHVRDAVWGVRVRAGRSGMRRRVRRATLGRA